MIYSKDNVYLSCKVVGKKNVDYFIKMCYIKLC